jgi:eukaryotic-like serine/threonine-protein kinase
MQVGCSRCGEVLEYSTRPPRFCSECGQPLKMRTAEATQPFTAPAYSPTTSAVFPLQQIGGYRLLRSLGSGGMGTVYECEQTVTGQRVAVKLIRPEFADSPDAVERFRREGRLASVVVHPRCVFVLAADEEAGRPYIVMELMPGDNLEDLVQRNGPLPPAEAVARILDVIEGLQEMHRCELVHRDVKPSNCFLDPDGRVKIGDFGLSKSLVKGGSKTQSGAFLGTLLFAAPEQIRGDKVDHQTDLYSLAATLYFLLTGRPPFEAEDPAATLARIVSDPLVPMRHWRPELPDTLDAIVRRGLARSRERRWHSLDDFRLALLPFVPGSHSLGELGRRSGAYLFDLLLTVPVVMIFLRVLHGRDANATLDSLGPGRSGPDLVIPELMLSYLAILASDLLYFAVPEHLWGCTPGKYLLGLRVRTVGRNDRPGLLRSLLRTFLFFLCKNTPPLLVPLLAVALVGVWLQEHLLALPGLELLGTVLGLLLLASTMRRGNGYRGIHEFLSGTRVIHLPGLVSRQTVKGSSTTPRMLQLTEGVPDRIGAFSILGSLRWTWTERILLAEDSILGRRVWLVLRPADEPPLPLPRRDVGRTTRARWLVSGRHDLWQWDAFVASEGCPLPDLIQQRRRLSWAETRSLLEPLTEELAAARADGTLPASLGLDQVWVQANGRVELLDIPMGNAGPLPPASANDQQRALLLLRNLVRLSLEGREGAGSAAPLQAPLPGHAARRINRLLGVEAPYATVEEFHADMESVRDRPAEVTRPRRGMHLTIQGVALACGLLFMLASVPLGMYVAFVDRLLLGFQGQLVLAELERNRPRAAANLVGQADPWGALVATGPLVDEDLLRPAVDRFERERQLMLQSASWFMLRGHEIVQRGIKKGLADRLRQLPIPDGLTPAQVLAQKLEDLRQEPLNDGEDVLATTLVISFWPALWIAWAFLMRGGLSYRLAGIALVQKDGRPAARWRCAWRALLVWLPVVLLLLASDHLEFRRLTLLAADEARALPELAWLAWLAWLTWWLALGLLPLYCWVAQRSPGRGLHDRLSGIDLVPH